MIVKCMNCEFIFDRIGEDEKVCCEKCVRHTVCPNCKSNAYIPIQKNESTEKSRQQILLD